jgi:hypothetical protein
LPRHGECLAKASEASVPFVGVEFKWVNDANAREGQAVLPLQPRVLVDVADAQVMLAPLQHACVEQLADVASLHRAVSDSRAIDVHLDKRFQPQQPSRSVADDLDVIAASRCLCGQCHSHLIGANGSC